MSQNIFTTIRANISGMQRIDPRTYEAFKMMIDELEDLFIQVNPLVIAVGQPEQIAAPDTPLNFTATLLSTSIQFNWNHVPGAYVYELRRGTDWEHAVYRFRTASLSANIPPLPIGTYHVLLKSISSSGSYSANAAELDFTVTGPFGVSPTAAVIDNNILLKWEPAISAFNIDYYIVDRAGVEVGRIYGTFATVFEGVAGTYLYGVTPVDIAGNRGPTRSVEATVTAPSDYILEAAYKSELDGTFYQTERIEPPQILACIKSETWEEHFVNNGWNTIQDQVNAGYPIYAQPMELQGTYEEVHDFGTVIENTVITLTVSQRQIVPHVGMISELSYSTDGVNFSPTIVGNTTYAPALQYVKIKLLFSTIDRRMLALFSNVTIALTVKRDLDSGKADCFADDVDGTYVTFNKPFKDVESITITAEGTEDISATYSFEDVLNPVGFYIFIYSRAGVRIDGKVSWKARGII